MVVNVQKYQARPAVVTRLCTALASDLGNLSWALTVCDKSHSWMISRPDETVAKNLVVVVLNTATGGMCILRSAERVLEFALRPLIRVRTHGKCKPAGPGFGFAENLTE